MDGGSPSPSPRSRGLATPDAGLPSDLFVAYGAKIEAQSPPYLLSTPRLATLSWSSLPGGGDLSKTAPSAMTWLNRGFGNSPVYFRELGPGEVDLTFWFEGDATAYPRQLFLRAAADAVARVFEHGVLANSLLRAVTFDLSQLAPGNEPVTAAGHGRAGRDGQ